MGCMNFIMQMNPEAVAKYPASHQALIENRPAWATLGFAVAVFGGALGCVLLLLRKKAALYLFIASLAGVIAATVHSLSIDTSAAGFSAGESFMMIAMPSIGAVFLLWYTHFATRKNWVA